MDKKWIEIARAGTFTDSLGRLQTFTDADLAAIASAYNPQKRDCPLVFGHPKTDAAPAFGWAQSVKAEGGRLFAQFAQVPGEVKELVAKGHYRHVSMSLMPDRKTLRHVALLGAAQPAIDGLEAVEFADNGETVTVDFAVEKQGDCMTVEELQRQIGQLQAELSALKSENADLKKKADAHKQDRDKAESAKNEAEQKAEKTSADFAAYREKIETERREARVSELVRAGKVKPAEKAGILDFAAKLALADGRVDFAAHGSAAAPQGSKPDFTSGAARASAPQDAGPSVISLEERYLRELEARPADERFADFAAYLTHTGGPAPTFDYNEMTAKL